MKTKKYYIEFDMYENSMGKVEISKKEYNEQLRRLQEECTRTHDFELPVERHETQVYNHPTTTETVDAFGCGCATTYLIVLECKEGYCFKQKKIREE